EQLVRAGAGGERLNVRTRQAIELDVIALLLELLAVVLAGQELRLADLQPVELRAGASRGWWRLGLGRRRSWRFCLTRSTGEVGTAALGRLTGNALETSNPRPNDADQKARGHDQPNPAKAQGFLLSVGNLDLQGVSSLCR